MAIKALFHKTKNTKTPLTLKAKSITDLKKLILI